MEDDEFHEQDIDESKKKKKKKKSKRSSHHEAIKDEEEGGRALDTKTKKKKKKKKHNIDDALEQKIRNKHKKQAEDSTPPDEEKVEEDSGFLMRGEDEPGPSSGSGGYGHSTGTSGWPGSGARSTPNYEVGKAGGGDVRLRSGWGLAGQDGPPPTPQGPPKPQVNERFADLHKTGAWGGTINKWEKLLLCLLFLGVVGAAIAMGVIFSRGDENEQSQPAPPPTKPPTKSPTEAPTQAPTDTDFRQLHGLELMTAASPPQSLPYSPEELIGARDNPESTPQEIAAEFVLYTDSLQIPARHPRFIERYALAVFYLQNGGCEGEWINDENWLDEKLDHCGNWYGIQCDITGIVSEITFGSNYVTGSIPIEFAQMTGLRELDLSNNRISGAVIAKAVALPTLFSLRLQNNDFSGNFPFADIRASATSLENLWIQENPKLIGEITLDYCDLFSVTLDCENFLPQPIYVGETSTTTFEFQCETQLGFKPTEYTCNFGARVSATKAPIATPTFSPSFFGEASPSVNGEPTEMLFCGKSSSRN